MHMDSAKAHSSTKIARLVDDWIRYEQDQSGGLSTSSRTRGALAMVCPAIAQQENGFDCGLYCCRFAYGLLKVVQHGSPFIYKDMYMERSPLYSRITCNSMFSFTPDHVYKFRTQLRQLIVRLSRIWQYKKTNPFVESLSTETPKKVKNHPFNAVGIIVPIVLCCNF
jgi:Ulp1 family protease